MPKSLPPSTKRLETPVAWLEAHRRATEKRAAPDPARPTLTSSDPLYSMARQIAIARKVDESGIPTRDPDVPTSRFTYTPQDFRNEFLEGRRLEPPEVQAWIPTMSPAASQKLEELKKFICRDFGWELYMAETFILTGMIPGPPPPIQVDCRLDLDPSARRIVLSIDPNSSKDEVATAYAEIKDQVLTGRVRRPEQRNLALSLQEYDRRESELGTWQNRMEHWNRHVEEYGYGHWTFDDRRQFRTEVMNMAERPLHAPWRDDLTMIGP